MKMNTREVVNTSINKALSSGVTGYSAMSLQVLSLMWLRTTVNYQYKNGTQFRETLGILYKQGGIPRFYRGLIPALFQAPLSRFGDVATNTGTLYYLNHNDRTKDYPIALKTFIGSMFAGLWRINLMPIDTTKTMMQVHGNHGLSILKNKIKNNGIRVLYNGSAGAYSATLIGHFPWFLTFNTLDNYIQIPDETYKYPTLSSFGRLAFIGFSSSFVSDCCSNSLRVIKTSKQTSKENYSYPRIVKNIIKNDGISGLFFRGLKTKIITNGVQGLLFTIIWKTLESKLN